jgi:hypothetical protein
MVAPFTALWDGDAENLIYLVLLGLLLKANYFKNVTLPSDILDDSIKSKIHRIP